MKKIFVCMFLLVFGLCLVGCEQPHTDPKDDNVIDGEYYAKVIYDSPFLSSRAYSRKITIDNNKLDNLEFIDYELQGDFFASIPNSDKDVFSSVMNIEKIWFAEVLQPEDIDGEFGYYLTLVNSNYYLYYGGYTEDNGYSIKHAYILIRLDSGKEILCDFLTLLNPLSVTLINGEGNSMIDRSYYDFESQLFFEEFMQIEVSKLDSFEKYDMPEVDYYISFSTFTEDFVTLQFYNVKNSDSEQYYGRIDGNLLDGIYQFSINKNLFNKVFDYFFNDTELASLFYSLQESFDNGFLTHEDLQQIANLKNNGPFNPIEIDQDIAILIMKDFCKMHNVEYEENGGSVRCFGEYNGYYAVMVDGCGFEYLTWLTSETAGGITFNYGSSQHILIWKYHE